MRPRIQARKPCVVRTTDTRLMNAGRKQQMRRKARPRRPLGFSLCVQPGPATEASAAPFQCFVEVLHRPTRAT